MWATVEAQCANPSRMIESPQAKNSRVKWEYKQVDTGDLLNRQFDLQDILKKEGDEGWEAYAVLPKGGHFLCFFKRPITVDPPPDMG